MRVNDVCASQEGIGVLVPGAVDYSVNVGELCFILYDQLIVRTQKTETDFVCE